MTWTYREHNGALLNPKGEQITKGYSGHELGKNNPDMADVVGVGPVPIGLWKIGEPHTSPNTGPYTMNLDPLPGTDTHGRSAFRIHGDSISNPGSASHGCVILIRTVRELIWNSGDHELEVTA